MNHAEIMEKTKAKVNESVTRTLEEANLPAYLAEGIILGVLADIRERKAAEMLALANNDIQKLQEERTRLLAELEKLKPSEPESAEKGEATETPKETKGAKKDG